jgi:hypothetical protein
VSEVVIDPLDPDTMALWWTVARIASSFEGRKLQWCLVGGLMVALFAIEAEQGPRVTADIDILGDTRSRPSSTIGVATALRELGATGPVVGGI